MKTNEKVAIGEAVRRVRMQKKMTLSQLADQITGYDAGNLSRFERGKQEIAQDKLQAIAEVLGITVANLYLIAETGNVENSAQSINNTIPALLNSKRVPLISWVHAGAWHDIVEDCFAEEWRETSAKVSEKAFALRVIGDSMTNPFGSPSIPEGAIVIVDPEAEVFSGKIVVAKLIDSQEATLKKLVIDGPNKYIVPLNPNYKPIEVNGNCKIVGVVKKMEIDF